MDVHGIATVRCLRGNRLLQEQSIPLDRATVDEFGVTLRASNGVEIDVVICFDPPLDTGRAPA